VPADEHNQATAVPLNEAGRGRARSPWSDLPLRFKGLVVVGLPVLALVISSLAFFASEREDRRAQSAVNRTLEVQAELRAILTLVVDAETAVRGYVIARRDSFLEPYLAAREKLPAALDRLGSLVLDPAQTRRLAPLRQSIDERLRLSEEIRRFPDGGGTASPGLVALLEQGRAATDSIRTQVATIEAAQDRLLVERRARGDRAHDRALVTIAASLVLGLGGGAAASVLFTRGVARRVGRLEDNAGRLAAGQELDAFPSSGDEVGRLGRGLQRAAGLLAEREAALRGARAFLEHLLTSGPVVVLRLALPEATLSYASPNVERLLGFTVDQARTAGEWTARIHPDDRPLLRAAVQRVTQESSAEETVEFRFRRGEGDERWLSALLVSERPVESPRRGVLSYLVDITERRQAEEALREREATLQAIIAASPDIITIIDPDGHVRLVNPAVRRMMGLDPSDLVGRDALERVHPDDQAAAALVEGLFAGNADELALQYRVRHADGQWLTLESHARLLTDAGDQPTGIVVVSRDVTERARLQQAQEEARGAAEAANRSKSEFLSRMSHELRTPLNAVLGFAQLLELDELTEDQQEAVSQILKGGRHLLDLINEVLDITRIETGQLTLSPEPVLIPDLLGDALDLVRPLAAARHIHLVGDPAASSPATHVFADRQRLKQILLNLLANAIKYNRAGGSVSVFCKPVGDTRLRIEVADTGRGIRPEHLPLLFTPFERLDADQSDVEGTGLGLALSRRLAEAMGGILDVSSTPGQGSTFWVELAVVEGPVERHDRLNSVPTDERTPPTAARRHRVLHIEDNLSNLKLVERILARGPAVEVIPAMQGRIGLDLAGQHQPAVILLDLHLPDMSGEAVLQQLRDDPATAAIPVIILSADATPGQVQRLVAAGALAYLTKPLDARELLRLLDQTLADAHS
jgi:PAS domain S-box-containing protein